MRHRVVASGSSAKPGELLTCRRTSSTEQINESKPIISPERCDVNELTGKCMFVPTLIFGFTEDAREKEILHPCSLNKLRGLFLSCVFSELSED